MNQGERSRLTNISMHTVSRKGLSLWGRFKPLFVPLEKSTTWRGPSKPWTTAHGFFTQMGGFVLYKNHFPLQVLTYDRLASLLQDKKILQPTVTERELRDRSKGDWVSKIIAVLQTLWFVVQCLARWGDGLSVSTLEVLTLAFAALNGAVYAAWWDKPQSVDTAVAVHTREYCASLLISTQMRLVH